MIAIDTSALMAICQNEKTARKCRVAIEQSDDILIAAPNLTEALVVAYGRQIGGEMGQLIADLDMTVVPFTENLAYAAHRAYHRWGKGYHPAKLNLADSFAYALATERGCPLLYVGDDFARTDVISALA